MAAAKPSIPKGTRDFSPAEMLRRDYIFDTVRDVFRLYGYQPIETPAMEYLSTLLGKYGEEGDKLIFRVLNSGDFLSEVSPDDLKNPDYQKMSSRISEKGLRYDLTVPFARFVVQHQKRNSLSFQTLPDSTGLACRQATERKVQGVLPMRCGCHWQRLTDK